MLGSNMTDFRGHLSWGFVRRCSFVVRRCDPSAFARGPCFRFECKSCQAGEGGTGRLALSPSSCKHGWKSDSQKVENRLHWYPARVRNRVSKPIRRTFEKKE